MASEEGGGARMLVCLCCLGAPDYASTPSCWHAGMLVDGQLAREEDEKCWHVYAAGVHLSITDIPAPKIDGMLAC